VRARFAKAKRLCSRHSVCVRVQRCPRVTHWSASTTKGRCERPYISCWHSGSFGLLAYLCEVASQASFVSSLRCFYFWLCYGLASSSAALNASFGLCFTPCARSQSILGFGGCWKPLRVSAADIAWQAPVNFNRPLVPTRIGEAPVLAAQRR